jgi:hypothetical protein
MNTSRKKRRSPRELVRDYSLYLLISFIIVASALWAAKSGVSDKTLQTWGGVALATPLVFGQFIAGSRKLWGRQRFWFVTTALLALHFLGYAVAFTYVSSWRSAWTFYSIVPEFFLLLQCSDWIRLTVRRPKSHGTAKGI